MAENYYLYLDEAGSFQNRQKEKSFVAGFVTKTHPSETIKLIDRQFEKFKSKHPKNPLTAEEVHASALLHPESFYKDEPEKKEKYESIPKKEREKFINSFREIYEKNHEFLIKSPMAIENSGDESTDPQNDYEACLIKCFIKVLSILSSENKKFNLFFAVARRNDKCLPEEADFHEYHEGIDSYLKNLKSRNANIGRTVDSFKGYVEIKKLLDIADIVCYDLSQNSRKTKKVHKAVFKSKQAEKTAGQISADFTMFLAKKSKLSSQKTALEKIIKLETSRTSLIRRIAGLLKKLAGR